jgi:L-ascorbate metabolism protein UlaG (beta-lactamase superfamily)
MCDRGTPEGTSTTDDKSATGIVFSGRSGIVSRLSVSDDSGCRQVRWCHVHCARREDGWLEGDLSQTVCGQHSTRIPNWHLGREATMSTRVQWLGHAALLLESEGRTVLIDPFLTGNPKAAAKAGEVPANLILISHGHGDHLGDAVAIAERTGATVAANYEIGEWLQQSAQGLSGAKVRGLQHGGSFLFDEAVRVKLTLAFHGSVLPDGSYGGNPCGFILTFPDGTRIYDAADTALFGDMTLIGDEGLDLAILPIGDYYTMGPDDALRAVKLLRPRHVLPIHYNTFPPIAQDANAWAARVKSETTAQPIVLQPGDWFEIPKK